MWVHSDHGKGSARPEDPSGLRDEAIKPLEMMNRIDAKNQTESPVKNREYLGCGARESAG